MFCGLLTFNLANQVIQLRHLCINIFITHKKKNVSTHFTVTDTSSVWSSDLSPSTLKKVTG